MGTTESKFEPTFKDYIRSYPNSIITKLNNGEHIVEKWDKRVKFDPNGNFLREEKLSSFEKIKKSYPDAPVINLENGGHMIETPYAYAYFDSEGRHHRDNNLPSFQGKDGDNDYSFHGVAHRTNGPAIEYHRSGEYEYWENGKFLFAKNLINKIFPKKKLKTYSSKFISIF